MYINTLLGLLSCWGCGLFKYIKNKKESKVYIFQVYLFFIFWEGDAFSYLLQVWPFLINPVAIMQNFKK